MLNFKILIIISTKVETNNDEKISLNLGKLVIENFFKVKRELTESIQKYELNMTVSESNDTMDIEFNSMQLKEETQFTDVIQTLERRKRACEDLFDINKRLKK